MEKVDIGFMYLYQKKLKLLLFCEDDLFIIFLKCKISTLLI